MAAIRSEGGLLPADILARVAALDRDLGGLTGSDFHLAPNERLGEAIARSWARLTAAWDAFSTDRDRLPAGDHAGRLTRERWLLPLFSELGYGRLVQQPGVEIEHKTYAVFCEYNHSPIHLVGAGVPLDRRTAGVRGAADQSPHSVVQELLNRSTERLWGVVTNGLLLRLLRDNVTLTRQAYVEFDLEAIFATEAYEDFALLWLCAHQSRLETEAPEECWLERWTQTAQRDGTRALGELRAGVERAIEALGRGFLAQRANTELHDALRDGRLDGPAYYRELLRLIYRLLFLFVAEDRDALLLPDDGTAERFDARQRYHRYYATNRLRRLSVRRRGGRAHDFYEQVKLLSGWLHNGGQPALALPPLGSALWSLDTTAHLGDARLGNEALLEAIRELSFVEGGRRPVDFRNLGAEELGSVYESLLELHPAIDREAARFSLTTAAGHERKQTGSYYTPTSLIGSLLETALDPVIDAAVDSDDPEQALLDLTLCDPACGSGHFLIAAANRIAKRLAGIREHDPEPAPEAIRHAMRDVVARCIHGVDVNPMAVDLCKVSLWLEALEPGRPLSFLDDRILCGNSLLGATPALVAGGVPDSAYKPLLGDDPDVAKAWRQHNARERKGQISLRLDDGDQVEDAESLAALAARLRGIPDESLEGVRAREAGYAQLVASPAHERLRLAADTLTAAFTALKKSGAARITTGVVRRATASGRDGLSLEELSTVERETDAYRPLHWHVAFPAIFHPTRLDVENHGWTGGFDCVLGNPPWERIKIQEKEWFATRRPDIAAARTKAARERLIKDLPESDPGLWNDWQAAKRAAEAEAHVVRASGRFPLCGRGDINTYSIFAEAMRSLIRPSGRVGVIVPTGIATDDTTKYFFQDLVATRALVSLLSFENEDHVFPGIHNQLKFCLATFRSPSEQASDPEFVFFARAATDLMDEWRRFTLSAEDIALLNPNTGTCPAFRSRRDAEITKRFYRALGPVVRDGHPDGDPWGIRFRTMFHMANDSGLFSNDSVGRLPLAEGKMFWQFDHRFGTYDGQSEAQANKGTLPRVDDAQHRDPRYRTVPAHWVRPGDVAGVVEGEQPPWFVAFRRFGRSVDFRTLCATALPWCGVGDSAFIVGLTDRSPRERLAFIACANSFVADYAARQKMTGANLNLYIFKQIAMPSPQMLAQACAWDSGQSRVRWLSDRALELVYTANDLDAIVDEDSSLPGPFLWDAARREAIRAEIDGAMLHLYDLDRDDAEHVLDSFGVARKYDEAEHGEFRTKRLVLERYDALAESIVSGVPHATELDPPPGDAAATNQRVETLR